MKKPRRLDPLQRLGVPGSATVLFLASYAGLPFVASAPLPPPWVFVWAMAGVLAVTIAWLLAIPLVTDLAEDVHDDILRQLAAGMPRGPRHYLRRIVYQALRLLKSFSLVFPLLLIYFLGALSHPQIFEPGGHHALPTLLGASAEYGVLFSIWTLVSMRCCYAFCWAVLTATRVVPADFRLWKASDRVGRHRDVLMCVQMLVMAGGLAGYFVVGFLPATAGTVASIQALQALLYFAVYHKYLSLGFATAVRDLPKRESIRTDFPPTRR